MSEQSGEKRSLPVSLNIIKQLWTPSHGVVVHKQKFDILSIIGRVTNINDQSTKCVYFVDDGTDGIDVLQWKGGDDNKAKTMESPITEGTYVRVHGQVRNQNNTLNFVAFKISPIKDFNEITAHTLEVVHNNLLLRKLKFIQLATRNEPTANGLMSGIGSNGNSNGVTPMEIGDIGSSLPPGMTKAQTMVLEALNKCRKEEGMSKDQLVQCLPSVDANTVQGALDFLSNEGHIFSTIDEFHFKSAYEAEG